jgi:hypothetical protein
MDTYSNELEKKNDDIENMIFQQSRSVAAPSR